MSGLTTRHIVIRLAMGLALLLATIAGTGCGVLSSSDLITSGTDADLAAQLLRAEPGTVISLSSTGGDPDHAQTIADIIEERELGLIIRQICASSCAEYLLPQASPLIFRGKPIIGYHQNPVMIDALRLTESDTPPLPTCNYGDNVTSYSDYSRAPNAWKETADRLIVRDVQLREMADCVQVGFVFQYDLWLPTSEQLRGIWKLDFDGAVCADDYRACIRTLDRIAPKNSTFVIGDTPHTVQ